MDTQTHEPVEAASALLDAIRSFPTRRELEHCGCKQIVSPFDLYATCPYCGARVKLRAFSAGYEIEDVFDAVFEWLSQPEAAEAARQRQAALQADKDE